ncbi:MAG: cytochrome c-type biogenesis protein CcmH [Bdellovibrionales bacterium]|nr:cytochrome c-type biogenesis protein CcmH [Bdellovibrionales bacterium]
MASNLNQILLAYLVTFLWALPLSAQQSAIDLQAEQIYQEVMSPFCPGRTLNNCPSTAASQLKDEIKSELMAGKDSHAIFAQLIERYGEEVRAAPPNRGFGRIAWLAPLIFLLLGALIIGLVIRRNKQVPVETTPATEIDPEVEARINAELDS